jgi:hypothetical protein
LFNFWNLLLTLCAKFFVRLRTLYKMSLHACKGCSGDCLRESLAIALRHFSLGPQRNSTILVIAPVVNCNGAFIDEEDYPDELLKHILIVMIESAEDLLEVARAIVDMRPCLVVFSSISLLTRPQARSEIAVKSELALGFALLSEARIPFAHVEPLGFDQTASNEFVSNWIF